jgi:hypothetical protein
MRIPPRFGYFVRCTGALSILAGCSGGSGSTPSGLPAANPGAAGQTIAHSARRLAKRSDAARSVVSAPSSALMFGDPDVMDAKAPRSGVYVGLFNANSANLYALPDAKNVAPVCKISIPAVNGLGTDSRGVTWIPGVPNDTDEVLSYAMNTCTAGKVTLTNPGGQPSGIAFATNGIMYVLNITTPKGTGSIAVYPNGAISPSFHLTPPGIVGYGLGIATDSKNNVYVAYQGGKGGEIAVFAGGKGAGKVLQNSADTLVGLTLDGKQNLLAANESATVVDVFQPPYTGSPTTILQKGEPIDLKLDAANKNLYVGDYSKGTLDVFSYPDGTYKYSISKGVLQGDDVEGVSVDPSGNG